MAKEKLIEQKLEEIIEMENKKHITHVGFAILTVYKDGKSIVKTAVRPGQEALLNDALLQFSNDYNDKYYNDNQIPFRKSFPASAKRGFGHLASRKGESHDRK